MEDQAKLLARGRMRRRLKTEPASIRYLRERAGLTQGELAELLGLSRAAVCRHEAGERVPSARVLDEYVGLLEALGEPA